MLTKSSCAGVFAGAQPRNVGPEYISYGELVGRRALSPGVWRSDLADILKDEIEARLQGPGAEARASHPVLIAEQDGRYVSRLIRLGLLDPEIVDEIAEGPQAPELTAQASMTVESSTGQDRNEDVNRHPSTIAELFGNTTETRSSLRIEKMSLSTRASSSTGSERRERLRD